MISANVLTNPVDENYIALCSIDVSKLCGAFYVKGQISCASGTFSKTNDKVDRSFKSFTGLIPAGAAPN